jgi:hypothetical protein
MGKTALRKRCTGEMVLRERGRLWSPHRHLKYVLFQQLGLLMLSVLQGWLSD